MASKSPPARQRYDAKNPVIAIRVTREQRERLRALAQRTGGAPKDLLLGALEEHRPLLKGTYLSDLEMKALVADVDEAAAKLGFERGYAKARSEFAVEYPCSSCSRPILVWGEQTLALVARILAESGLVHNPCPDQLLHASQQPASR